MRISTLRAYDGRNGLAVHQCVSFIFESGRRNGAPDLARRTEAHHRALRALLEGVAEQATAVRHAVEEARAEAGTQPLYLAQEYLPVPTAESVLIERIADGGREAMPLGTLNALAAPVLAVPRPQAYWIAEEALARLEDSLAAHAIVWERPSARPAARATRFRVVGGTGQTPPGRGGLRGFRSASPRRGSHPPSAVLGNHGGPVAGAGLGRRSPDQRSRRAGRRRPASHLAGRGRRRGGVGEAI